MGTGATGGAIAAGRVLELATLLLLLFVTYCSLFQDAPSDGRSLPFGSPPS
jgi:hypothetical protein